MKNVIKFCLLMLVSTKSPAHEQWLLTHDEINFASKQPQPDIFTQFNLINSSLTILTIIGIFLWILINNLFPQKINISKNKIHLCVRLTSIATGIMLILCALGLVPKVGISYFQEPVYLASDLLIPTLGSKWLWLKWAELLIGLALVFQIGLRLMTLFLLGLVLMGIFLFGKPIFQYLGFYLAIIYLLLNGSTSNFLTTLKVVQILTGINFIYSALSVKWMTPNVDILMIKKHHAFTFGIPTDYFVFLMFIVEFSFGILFILGYRLRLISIALLLLFLFMSINFAENFLTHTFIYGILLTFIMTNGVPLINKNIIKKQS